MRNLGNTTAPVSRTEFAYQGGICVYCAYNLITQCNEQVPVETVQVAHCLQAQDTEHSS